MVVLLTLMYAIAALLSIWGVVGPLWSAHRLHARAERAKAVAAEVERVMYAELEDPDETVREAARPRQKAALAAEFESSGRTLGDLSAGWIFHGGSTSLNALRDAKSRAVGLGWVVAGVVLGAFTSALSLWVPLD